jgi:hypothetical protein
MVRLSAGLLLSRTGDQLTTIALLWFVLDLTGSSVAVGLVLLCAGLPPVVTGPLLGRALDRWSPPAGDGRRQPPPGGPGRGHPGAALARPPGHAPGLRPVAGVRGPDPGHRRRRPRGPSPARRRGRARAGQRPAQRRRPGERAGRSGRRRPAGRCGGRAGGAAAGCPVVPGHGRARQAAARPAGRRGGGATGPGLRHPGGARRPEGAGGLRHHPGLLPGLRAAGAGPAPVQPRRARRRAGRLRPALVGVRGRRAARPGHRAGRRPPAPGPRPGRERPGLGADAPAPALRHQHRPGDAGPGRRRVDLGAVCHPRGVPAPAAGPGLPARPGVRRPPGGDGRGHPAGRRRRRAAPRPRHRDRGHRPVRGHLRARRGGRPLPAGPPPDPGPARASSSRRVPSTYGSTSATRTRVTWSTGRFRAARTSVQPSTSP